jgi:RNA-directed DNA polymerase
VTRSRQGTGEETLPNGGAPDFRLAEANAWVLHIQTKLHQWAKADSTKRFDNLFNLVCDPATLQVAWDRVKQNRGSRTAGVDGETRWRIEHGRGGDAFLEDTRAALRERTYRPDRVRQHGIPKANGKVHYLGIPTIRDRVVQMALKLILEPIFEADFVATSYGFRPGRRAHDAIAEIYHFAKNPSNYEYIVEGDIEACFDSIDRGLLLARVRQRIADKKVLALVKAFLRAGILTEEGVSVENATGTPQGGILSPLLANIALSELDDHFEQAWRDQARYPGHTEYLHHQGRPTYRLIRYADDFVLMVKGTHAHAEALREEVGTVLTQKLRLKLSPTKTLVTHIDDGFTFLGFRIQRQVYMGKRFVYTFPSPEAFKFIKRKVKALTRHTHTSLSLRQLLYRLNPLLHGWANYFRHAASKRTFAYLSHLAWWRVARWLWKKHKRPSWKRMRRRVLRNWEIGEDGIQLIQPHRIPIVRYRYRGTRIPSRWEAAPSLVEALP